VSNECLKKSAQPYPSFFDCSLLFYAFYDRDPQTAKKSSQIKKELQILSTEWQPERECCYDMSRKPIAGSMELWFFLNAKMTRQTRVHQQRQLVHVSSVFRASRNPVIDPMGCPGKLAGQPFLDPEPTF
jgi:hypothetical protein